MAVCAASRPYSRPITSITKMRPWLVAVSRTLSTASMAMFSAVSKPME